MGRTADPIRPRARFVASATLVLFAIVQLSQFAGVWQHVGVGGLFLGGDFVVYYQAGTLLDRVGGERLYDLDEQRRMRAELFPTLSEETADYYLYAPWMAVAVRPLSWLPYKTAFGIWLGLNAALMVLAVGLAWGKRSERAGIDRTTATLVALSWYPCLLILLSGGQSALPVLAISLAAACDRGRRPVLAGAALALMSYKPTLAGPVLLMLLIAGRWRSLLGFAAGAAGLGAIGWEGAGPAGLGGFLEAAATMARLRATRPELFSQASYIDLRSAIGALLGFGPASTWLAAALLLAGLAWLAPGWWRAGRRWQERGESAWAQASAWLPMLAPHLGAYDATVVIPGVVLALRELDRSGRSARGIAWPVGVAYLAGTVSQPMARAAGIPALTIALAWLAAGVSRATAADAGTRSAARTAADRLGRLPKSVFPFPPSEPSGPNPEEGSGPAASESDHQILTRSSGGR
ncbi:glycosyltransferase family 87 protein [Tautonia sociabilis]|uniref:DUF2029 domain-containing protein n=1 Tax=Tautonia sociabilis TaxID=2080755 RepID=A0A432MNC1_9BACT|nr:glycosyltransferase family 87 protein [Tautonia sociabilis]RUL88687.1 DUF2029 domain-containing protein [Tautonia sociabilis]